MDMVSIPRKEYERLRKLEKQIEFDGLQHVKESISDLKGGRVEVLIPGTAGKGWKQLKS